MGYLRGECKLPELCQYKSSSIILTEGAENTPASVFLSKSAALYGEKETT